MRMTRADAARVSVLRCTVSVLGEFLAGDVLVPVPHRHWILALPKMLRPYFKFHRALLKDLCRIAHHCLTEYFQERGSGSPKRSPPLSW